MGIIKIEVSLAEATQSLEQFKNNRMRALEILTSEVRSAVSQTINQILYSEMALFLGKPDQAGNKRNGYEEREYALKGVGCVRIRMPVDRKRAFKSVVIPPSEQIDPRLKEDLAMLHLAGLSTRTLSLVSRRLLGVEISRDTVSKSLGCVEVKAIEWLTRPIDKKYWALFIDGTQFKIQRRGSTDKEPSLVVLGIDQENKMSILSIEPGQKDSASCWRSVLKELKNRGLDPDYVQIGIMDGLPGLETVFKEEFPMAKTARCWVHALKNVLAKMPQRLQTLFKKQIIQVMYASDKKEAKKAYQSLKEQMGKDADRAIKCLEKDIDSLLVHYDFDRTLWRVLKTTNPIERVNKELKRRTKLMETVGERTLEILLAFTALRLEYGWQKHAVNSKALWNLKNRTNNSIEATLEQLLH